MYGGNMTNKLHNKLFHSPPNEQKHNKRYLYDKDNNLIVYNVNFITTCEYSTTYKPNIERIMEVKYNKERVWQKRKQKLEATLTENEKKELEVLLKEIEYKLFPVYSCNNYLLVPEGSIIFNSRFECGNLEEVVLIGENEYNLLVRPDTSTAKYSQWFYFCARNTHKRTTVKLNIINLRKNLISYSDGMMPSVYSKEKERNKKITWHNAGNNITYKKSTHYTLSFTYTFEYSFDCVYFAHIVPYSYSKLECLLNKIKKNPLYTSIVIVKKLCYTFAMNKCPYVIVTEDCKNYSIKKKPAIIVTARLHPGESNSSYVLEGFLQFLLSSDPRARTLRSTFIFHIIPMLNPDGVIYGNYRCSVIGIDLNRKWKNPNKLLQPTIYHTKELIKQLQANTTITSFIDLHGHSSSRNTFLLGCQPAFNDNEYQEKYKRIKLFAKVLAKLIPSFSLEKSKFTIEKNKLSTGRVVMCKEFCITQSYTLEIACYGSNEYDTGKNIISNLLEIGRAVAITYFTQQKVLEVKRGNNKDQVYNKHKLNLSLFSALDIEEKTIKSSIKLFPTKQLTLKDPKKVIQIQREETQNGNLTKKSDEKCKLTYDSILKREKDHTLKQNSALPIIRKQSNVVFVKYHLPIVRFMWKDKTIKRSKRVYSWLQDTPIHTTKLNKSSWNSNTNSKKRLKISLNKYLGKVSMAKENASYVASLRDTLNLNNSQLVKHIIDKHACEGVKEGNASFCNSYKFN